MAAAHTASVPTAWMPIVIMHAEVTVAGVVPAAENTLQAEDVRAFGLAHAPLACVARAATPLLVRQRPTLRSQGLHGRLLSDPGAPPFCCFVRFFSLKLVPGVFAQTK